MPVLMLLLVLNGSTFGFGFDRDYKIAWGGLDVLRCSTFAPLENARGQGPK